MSLTEKLKTAKTTEELELTLKLLQRKLEIAVEFAMVIRLYFSAYSGREFTSPVGRLHNTGRIFHLLSGSYENKTQKDIDIDLMYLSDVIHHISNTYFDYTKLEDEYIKTIKDYSTKDRDLFQLVVEMTEINKKLVTVHKYQLNK